MGVVSDYNLSWSHHFLNLSRKLAKFAPILYRVRKLCTHKSLGLMNNCLTYSNLIYSNNVWGHCENVTLKSLLTTHKRIIRSIAAVNISTLTHEHFHRFSFWPFLTFGINFYLQMFSKWKYASWFRQSENGTRSTWYTEQNLYYILGYSLLKKLIVWICSVAGFANR